MKSIIIGGALMCLTFVAGCTPQPAVINKQGGEVNNTNTTQEKTFTMADVSTHNSATSCYSVVDGSVYDLTS